jgi:hypothetical protein
MLRITLPACAFAALFAVALVLAPSPSRAADFKWHGLLDLVAAERTEAFELNTLTHGDNPFDPYRARLFAESQVNDRLQVIGQFVYDDASGVYVDGAYAIYTPWTERDLHALVGKIPWAIGTWAPRTYSNKNPLISAPLIYQHHTTLLWFDIPPSADQLLSTAGTGAAGVNYRGFSEGSGMPIVDDNYWDTGITIAGSERPVELAASVTSGSPSWASTSQDDNSGKSVMGRIGFTPVPALRVGVSGSIGPYLHQTLDSRLPAGKNANDYDQKLVMADLEVLVGHLELRAEGARNIWETSTLGDLSVNSAYGELKYLLDSGLSIAGRYDVERFGEIQPSVGPARPWDWNVARAEGGLGYRITREVLGKLVYQYTEFDPGVAGVDKEHRSMFAAQLSVGF